MNDLYKKLVDLYAGEELTEELSAELEQAAMSDPVLSHDMFTLRKTVEALHGLAAPDLTPESDYRILLRLQLEGTEARRKSPDPGFWQYHLPIQS